MTEMSARNRYLPETVSRSYLRDRLFRQLVIDPSGCLLWTGKTDRRGYGRVGFGKRQYPVHCLMYELFVEPVPEGLELDHVKARGCHHRNCGSPAHLEPVTSLENKIRAQGFIAANVAATHCGTCSLPYDDENTYWTPSGRRDCRNCRREADWRREQKRREHMNTESATADPGRLDIRHLRNHALKAMAARRIGVAPEHCLLGIDRDEAGAVIIHVNSGGNVCAVEQWLNLHGYRAEFVPSDEYGGKVRVTLRMEAARAAS